MSSAKPFAGAISIYSGPADYNKPLKELSLFSAVASRDIAADAKFSVSLSDLFGSEGEFNDALNATGVTTQIMSEKLAELARGSDADYTAYQETKRAVLNTIRARIIRLYAETYNQLLTIGYTKEEARNKALQSAMAIKQSQMEIFTTLFPQHGQKAQRIY